MNAIMNSYMKWKAFFLALVFGAVFSSPVFAWTNPAANPATGGGTIIAEQGSPANVIYIKSNGNVGIGTSNPAAKLEVSGLGNQNITITSTNHSDAGLILMRNENSYFDWKMVDSGGNLLFQRSADDGLNWSTNVFFGGSSTTNGMVGIGTTSPTVKLEVAGTVKATAFEGPLSGTISAPNVSAGEFGANTGGGNYSFPGHVGFGNFTVRYVTADSIGIYDSVGALVVEFDEGI
ncbi:MAG: hypothetical protein M0Q27_00935 [Candidatus Colwellbacteria bacterium]|jgi:hypothetical protein|nr:hypothetical protein [Candidatus Colwellbacteria bacterium]